MLLPTPVLCLRCPHPLALVVLVPRSPPTPDLFPHNLPGLCILFLSVRPWLAFVLFLGYDPTHTVSLLRAEAALTAQPGSLNS